MKPKAKAKRKPRVEADRTIGVRFITSGNFSSKVYTYRIAKKHKVFLGQELVVHNHIGSAIVVVVQIGEDTEDFMADQLKRITLKVAPL